MNAVFVHSCASRESTKIKQNRLHANHVLQDDTKIRNRSQAAKMIVALDRTLHWTKLHARFVLQDNTRIKILNQVAKIIVALDRTLRWTKVHAPFVVKVNTKIRTIKQVAKLANLVKSQLVIKKHVF